MGSCSRPRADHSSRANFFLQPPIVQCTPLDLTCTERERSAGRMVFLSISHSLTHSVRLHAQNRGTTLAPRTQSERREGWAGGLLLLPYPAPLYVRIKSETCGAARCSLRLNPSPIFTFESLKIAKSGAARCFIYSATT